MKKRILVLLLAVTFILTACKGNKSLNYINDYNNYDTPVFIENSLMRFEGYAKTLCVVAPDSINNDSDTSIDGVSALLFDISDQKIIFNKNIFQKMYPASTTKILTAYVALKYAKIYGIDFSKTIKVSDCVNNIVAGAKLSGLLEGDTVTLKDVMYCTLLESGNDAALILAENIAGSVPEFVKLMNEEARKLGATNSNFVNPHGLFESEHYTTAYDLYLIFNEAIKLPEFREYISTPTYTFKYTTASGVVRTRVVNSTNQYINGNSTAPDGITVLGGKTGFEDYAGRCLVILSKKNDKEYISIILNSSSSKALYENMNKLISMEN